MEDGPKSLYSQASRPKKYLATFGLIYGCFSLGICMTFLSPTVLDFSHKLNEPVDGVSIVFTVITASYLFGALFCGVASNYIPRAVNVILVLSFLTIPLFIIPFVESVMMLYVLAASIGFGGGGYDAAQACWIIDIWRHEAAPFILSLHFAYSAGTLVPPLILGPYLTEEEEETDGTTTTPRTSSTELPYESQLETPFIIGGCIACLAVLILSSLYLFLFREKESSGAEYNQKNEIEMNEANTEISTETVPPPDLKRKMVIVVLCCFILGFYAALELCTSQFIPTFSHFSEVGLSEKQSAKISFGLQLGFASGRLFGILLVLKIAPHFIWVGNFVLLLISNIILLVWAGSNVTWLWIGSVGIGLGMSTFYGAFYSYIEKYIFVTDGIASTFAVCAGLVGAIYPIIVGKSVEKNPEVMTYLNFLSIFVCFVSFSILFYITHVKAARKQKTEDARK